MKIDTHDRNGGINYAAISPRGYLDPWTVDKEPSLPRGWWQRDANMGLASSLEMTKQCVGPEVVPAAVKLLAGATQDTIEVTRQKRLQT